MKKLKTPRVRYSASSLLKELAWNLFPQEYPAGGAEPIYLHASRRSGSTLLMEVLASNPGVSFHDQPFSIFTNHSMVIRKLPFGPYGQFCDIDPWEQTLLRAHVERMITGKEIVNGPWRFWTKEYRRPVTKTVLKITDAKTLVSWFPTQVAGKTVILTRHPISQALSVFRNKWMPTGRGFFRSPAYVEQFLAAGELEQVRAIYESDDLWAHHITDWILENRPLIRELSNPEVIFAPYEVLTLNPEKTCEFLGRELGLPDVAAMVATATRPSRSTKRSSVGSTKDAIKRRDPETLVGRWRKEASAEQIATTQRLLDQFKVTLYSTEDALPNLEGIACKFVDHT